MWSDLRKSEGDSLIENIILTKKVGVGGVGEIEWFRNRKIFGFGGVFFCFCFSFSTEEIFHESNILH